MDFIDFINKESLILVAAIYALGMMLKNTKKIPDYLIPFLLLGISIGFCIGRSGFNVNSVIQAILIVAVAVYSNQLFKQSTEALIKEDQPQAPKEINPTSITEFRE